MALFHDRFEDLMQEIRDIITNTPPVRIYHGVTSMIFCGGGVNVDCIVFGSREGNF